MQVNEAAAYLQRIFCWQERKHYQNETNRELVANVIHNSTASQLHCPFMFSWAAVRDRRNSPISDMAFTASYSPSPWLLLSLASLYLQYKLEALINIFIFFIRQSKSSDVGLMLATKGENQKETREKLCSRSRDCMSERGLKIKRLCSMFIPLCCNYPTIALILAAKNNKDIGEIS